LSKKEEVDLENVFVGVLEKFLKPVILDILEEREDFFIKNIVASTDSSLKKTEELLLDIDERLSKIENYFMDLKCYFKVWIKKNRKVKEI